MTEDSVTLFLDLANDFPLTEGSQKNIQAEDRQSTKEMMEILNCIKSEIESFKRKQEVLDFANPPRLKTFPRFARSG